jgi:cysteinyl-tRNA synthetase
MEIALYNSLTRRKEAVRPTEPGHLRLYACGPTVYSYAHIGNARMAVVFDLLVRVARARFRRVTYVSNITDVDDKIIAASRAGGEDIASITERYTGIYNEDMAALGCAPPDVQPRATAHIGDMVALIEKLLHTGHAYAADGHVLFHVPSYAEYGALSGRSREEQVAGARVEVAPYKRDPADFVLWKPSGPGEPGWESPWGRGRPGWHIECSAMSQHHLGLPFDIHGGGADLKFPHHENEIAQSCCAHGTVDDPATYARMWVHNGFVTVAGEKMAKSVGNVLIAHDLLRAHEGAALRLALLSAHYRQPLDWTEATVHAAEKNLATLRRAAGALPPLEQGGGRGGSPAGAVPEGAMAALHDDLNTPLAIAEMLRAAKAGDGAGVAAAMDLMGLFRAAPETQDHDPGIDQLLQERQAARAARDFARADAIRDQLSAQGVTIEDTPAGPTWRRV